MNGGITLSNWTLCFFLHFLWAVSTLNLHFAPRSVHPSPRSVNFAPIGVFLILQCDTAKEVVRARDDLTLFCVINNVFLMFLIDFFVLNSSPMSASLKSLKYYFGDSRTWSRSILTRRHIKVNPKVKNVKIWFLANTNSRRSVVRSFDVILTE